MRARPRLYSSLASVSPLKVNNEMALTVNGTELELVPSLKLLGLEIDSELSFNSHVEKLFTFHFFHFSSRTPPKIFPELAKVSLLAGWERFSLGNSLIQERVLHNYSLLKAKAGLFIQIIYILIHSCPILLSFREMEILIFNFFSVIIMLFIEFLSQCYYFC